MNAMYGKLMQWLCANKGNGCQTWKIYFKQAIILFTNGKRSNIGSCTENINSPQNIRKKAKSPDTESVSSSGDEQGKDRLILQKRKS